MVNKKLEQLREKVKERKQKRKRKQRFKQRKQKKKQLRSQQRVKANEPETKTETAKASARQARLLAAELGVTRDRASEIAARGSELIDKAEASGTLDQFDLDGDGDTDILTALDEPGAGGGQRGGQAAAMGPTLGNPDVDPYDVVDPTEPVMDFGEMTDPQLNDFDVEGPIEEEIFSL